MQNELADLYTKILNTKTNKIGSSSPSKNTQPSVIKKSNLIEESKSSKTISNTKTQDPLKKFLQKLSSVQIVKPTEIKETAFTKELDKIYENTAAKLPAVEHIINNKTLSEKTTSKLISESSSDPVDTNSNPLKTFFENLAIELKKQQNLQNEKIENEEEEQSFETSEIEETEEESQTDSQESTVSTTSVYIQGLGTPEKQNSNQKDTELHSLVQTKVTEIFGQHKQQFPNFGFTGGGGGTNAIQYAEGGTMDGDLNVNGRYLSGGRDLATIFATIGSGGGGGGIGHDADKLVSGPYSLVLNNDGSVTFPNNTIAPDNNQILSLESGQTTSGEFTRIAMSPYAFFAYDGNANSITFDSVDNDIILTSQDQYEWTFNSEGLLVGPSGVLVTTDFNSTGVMLSSGKNLTEIFLLSSETFTVDGGEY